VPVHAPAGIAFADSDPVCWQLGGDVVIHHATSESDVTAYALYYGSSPTQKLYASPIVSLLATGSDVHYTMTREVHPIGATHLLAFSVNGAGEMATGVATPLAEAHGFSATELSAGDGVPSGGATYATAVIDAVGGALLVVTEESPAGKLSLYRCNLDGSACVSSDISAGHVASDAPSAVIDTAAGKLLVVTNNMQVRRCNLDGSACTFIDGSGGQPGAFGASAVIDAVNQRLLVVAQTYYMTLPYRGLILYRCNLDGTGCTANDYSQTVYISGPRAAIDTVNGKLVFAATDGNTVYHAGLYRCGLDGTGCTGTDVSAGWGDDSGFSPSLALDLVNNKALVVSLQRFTGPNNSSMYGPVLSRCNLDGTGCTLGSIAGVYTQTYAPTETHSLIDAVNHKLLVVTTVTGSSNAVTPTLLRCELDGTGCAFFDLSAGRQGYALAPVIDTARGNLLTVGVDDNGGAELFTACSLQ
jgi:hypothetical protein